MNYAILKAVGVLPVTRLQVLFRSASSKNRVSPFVAFTELPKNDILQYACAYGRKYPSTQNLRLFIVSIDYSQDVDDVCEFLRSEGIVIHHIAIEKVLSEN